MARLKDSVDLYFTETGDFFLDTNGDLADTSKDLYRGLVQRIDTRMKSSKQDWATQPSVGAGLTDFLGKRNTAELGQVIKSRVYSELYQEDLLRAGEVVVETFPISKTQVGISIIISPPRSSGRIALIYSYDMRDNKLMMRNL